MKAPIESMDRILNITLRSVGKRYGFQWVVRRLSTVFHGGQLTVILGKNGAGKSTLLSLLCTLLHADEGEILYNERPSGAYANAWLRQQIGVVNHDFMSYPQLSALENLTFFGTLYGYSTKNASDLAHEWLEKTKLFQVKHKQVKTFSQGMKKRLSIAKAFLHSPSILLLDEPYTALDVDGKQMVTSCVKEAKERGAIVILATHEPAEIASHCNEAILLQKGELSRQTPISADNAPLDLSTLLAEAQ